jgi:hypothetical protein
LEASIADSAFAVMFGMVMMPEIDAVKVINVLFTLVVVGSDRFRILIHASSITFTSTKKYMKLTHPTYAHSHESRRRD